MFEIIFTLAVAGYFIQTIVFLIGTNKKFPRLKHEELPTASVIVAARNEEENILRCLESLVNLIYPEGKLEIILVNDHSTDRTSEIIEKFIEGKDRFKKIDATKEFGKLRGKTNALANGIEAAKNDVILTTDADCAVSPKWAQTIASYYVGNVAVVNGFTDQVVVDGFSGMQNLDFLYLLTVASGCININNPITCIGNNMSYLRKAYHEVGGYQNLPFSVTEDFVLLDAIRNLKKYKLVYPLDADALVTSLACKDWKTLNRQKKRWGVGGLRVPITGYTVLVSGFVAHICIFLFPFYFSISGLYLIFFKLLCDYLLLKLVSSKLRLRGTMKYFLQFELYYLVYVVVLPLVVFFDRRVEWKGRKY